MKRHAALAAALAAGLSCQAILAAGAVAAPQTTGTTGLCPTPAPVAAAADAHDVFAGAWSYFGDPRAIAHGTRVFTGCVSTTRGIVVHQYDLRTGATFHALLHRNKELDDHDNPSLAFWRGRVYAFYSPHSGTGLPSRPPHGDARAQRFDRRRRPVEDEDPADVHVRAAVAVLELEEGRVER